MTVIGVIAGSGTLPQEVIQSLTLAGKSCVAVGFENVTTAPAIHDVPHHMGGLGEVGKAIQFLKKKGAHTLVLVGKVGRPEIKTLALDWRGLRLLTRLKRLKNWSDDTIFRTILSFLEEQGFEIQSVAELCPNLMAPKGALGNSAPDAGNERDIVKGIEVARAMGALDIGQAVVVEEGVVLAVEALEGTDAMIERSGLVKSKNTKRAGVLVKLSKPTQDLRIDLPTIGVATVERVYHAGLAGIAVEAEKTLLLNPSAIRHAADTLGVFVVGV